MSKYIGDVSAYAYAVSKGYTGTEEEFAELMASYVDVGQTAVDAKDAAVAAKTAAQTAATTATNKASEATTAAQTATTKAGEAQTSAQTASTKASEASQSASQASGYAQTAETAKTDAQTAKTQAETARDNAVTAKTAAETAQGKAEDAQAAAESVAESIPSDYSQLSEDVSDLKSEITALESDGVAPSAEQLLSKNTTADAVPYLFRKTGGDGADREYVDAIVGGTVCFNQLFNTSNYAQSTTSNGITFTNNGDGTVTANGTATARANFSLGNIIVISGHVYIYGTPDTNNAERWIGNSAYGTQSGMKYMHKLTTNGQVGMNCMVASGTTLNNYVFKPQFIDLTAFFGSTIADYIYQLEQTTAGAGVALFKSLFPNDYYEYNAGELKSVEGVSAHEMVGFNQWDEEWEVGGYASSNGEPWNTNTRIRSKTNKYIPVKPNTTYYLNMPTGNVMYCDIMFYNAGKTFISRTNPKAGTTFTTPSDARFMRFASCTAYGTTYNHDICINLSDPTKNGTYEPYKARSYPLDSSLTLRGIPKLSDGKMYFDGDRYLPDGTVTRKYGIVDLGRLNWSYSATNTIFMANLATSSASTTKLGVCQKYATVTYWVSSADWANNDKIITFVGGDKYVRIKDTSYTDAATFKEAMSGVYLVYELAEPTIEDATPYRQLQICDPNGTEEFVSTGIVPVGHETRYPENLRAKIDGFPWDFSSLIAPTEKSTTASRNYTTGSLLIMGNVLYKVTANIANGGTITPNTNVTATTLSEILSALAQ